jgi:hypothetical protein
MLVNRLKGACGAFRERAEWLLRGPRAKNVVFAREKHAG